MTDRAAERAVAERLRQRFEQTGAQVVEADILQPANLLLDLYGEDIRARAYVTMDTTRGELMLRPDFTVPVVQMHMEHGAEPARYTYCGEVFRRQQSDETRASEYMQVGYEIFERSQPWETDAELFSLFYEILAPLSLRAATGDIGILKAAVTGLKTSEARKRALLRHIWRPRRFRALLDRFSGRAAVPPSRAALLATPKPLEISTPHIGLRGLDEIAERVRTLHEDAQTPPIAENELQLIDALLSVRETSEHALSQLHDIAVDMPAIAQAVERLELRLEALTARGIDISRLEFEASYGRTQMEYYDGFVFGFYTEDRPDISPVATGGRYDALTRHLGGGREIPAVGGVIRPGFVATLEKRQ